MLPTMRLAKVLFREMTHHRQCFVPPKVVDWSGYLAGIDPLTTRAATAVESELIIAQLLGQTESRYFAPYHAAALVSLLEEMVHFQVSTERLNRLAKELQDEDVAPALVEKLAELGALSRLFDMKLKQHGKKSRARHLENLSNTMNRLLPSWQGVCDQHEPFFNGISQIHVLGFTIWAPMFSPLLHTLGQHQRVKVWLQPPEQFWHDENHPVRRYWTGLGWRADLEQYAPIKHQGEGMRFWSCPRTVDQYRLAAQLATSTPTSECAIVTVAPADCRDALREQPWFENTQRETRFVESPLGSLLQAVARFVAQGESTVALIDVIREPAVHGVISNNGGNGGGKGGEARARDQERMNSLATALLQTNVAADLDLIHQTLSQSPVTSPGNKELFGQLYRWLNPVSRSHPRSLADWGQYLATFIRPLESSLSDSGRRTQQRDDWVWQEFYRFLEALRTFPESSLAFDSSFAWGLIERHLLNQRRRKEDELDQPCQGVQVLSFQEVAVWPMQRAIIIDCQEQNFPLFPPDETICENHLRRRLGLRDWQMACLESELAIAPLWQRLTNTELVYAHTDGTAEPLNRARFVEGLMLRHQGDAIPYSPPFGSDSAGNCDNRASSDIAPPAASAWQSGQWVQEFRSPVSATGLERLMRCPFSFLLYKLGIDELRLPLEGDPRTEGEWLHATLEAFFTGKVGDCVIAESLEQEIDLAGLDAPAFRKQGLARLLRIAKQLVPAAVADGPADLHAQYRSWPRFIDHLLRVYSDTRTAMTAGFREFALRDVDPALDIGRGDPLHVSGIIDSVDRLPTFQLITDYKRKTPPKKGDVMSGRSPQLLLYALALSAIDKGDFSTMGIGYYNVLNGEWLGIAAGTAVRDDLTARRLFSKQQKLTLEDTMNRFLASWRARDQQFFADGDVTPDASHCHYCRLSGACRRDLGADFSPPISREISP